MVKGEISGKTKVCALIGDPVEHTVSPAMHNAAFKAAELDFIYVPFRVKPENLKKAVNGLRALNVRGFNVTIPHKVPVIKLLDSLDPLARDIGAVNTVVNDNGKLIGFNTDAEGFLRAMRERGVEPANKKIVIIGAGGASRSISYILARENAFLTLSNRSPDPAYEIARLVQDKFGKSVTVCQPGKSLENTDILVNATSIGMTPGINESPVPAGLLTPGLTVFDIVYNPVETRLLREAKAAGAKAFSGLDMLAWQGALAFEKWTGQPAPLDLMRRKALEMLEKREK
jgi:shikimate dehydrogenase